MLDPAVAKLIGELADQGITVFVPQGAEHMLHVEDGNLVIHTKLLEVVETIHCFACGYVGDDVTHECGLPLVSSN